MGRQYWFYIDVDRCVQCHACEVACKANNSIELGIKWRKVIGIWAGRYPDLISRTVSFSCMHCAQPACAKECPAGAITKRPEDGIVAFDRNKCIGCRSCAEACPFSAPQYGKDGTMQKCNMCLERVTKGGHPACAKTCPGEALHFGTMMELNELSSIKKARKLHGPTQPSMLISSSHWSILQPALPWK